MIQQAQEVDLLDIHTIELRLEGEGAAKMETLLGRLEMFPEGFLVARLEGQLIGYSESCLWDEAVPSFRAEENFFKDRHRAHGTILYIIFVGVLPEYQRQGVASKLLVKLQEVARKMGAAKVHVVTWERLEPLYIGKGFKPIGYIADFLPNGIFTHLEYKIGCRLLATKLNKFL